MSTTMTRRNGAASPDSANRAARQATLVGQKKDPVRRRWGRIGGGVFAAVVGGWLFASLYLSADDRVEVLAVASDIGRFDVIERSDLRVVTIGEDTRVVSLIGRRLQESVGVVARFVDCLLRAQVRPRQLADSKISLSCLVDEQDYERAARALHEEFIERSWATDTTEGGYSL